MIHTSGGIQMLKKGIVKATQAFTLVVAGFLLVWMLAASWFVEWDSSLKLTTGVIISSSLMVIAILALVIGGSYWLTKKNTSWLIGSFVGLTLLKLPLVAWLPIKPTSDFWNYHTLAAFNAQGLTWHHLLERGDLGNYVIFPHALNIANFFSFSVALAGNNFFVSQLINISCTFIDMLLIYWLVSRWLSRRLGIVASLIFYCIPAYWIYSTLLNGAEPFFVTCVLITMLTLTKAFAPLPTATTNDQWINLIFAWVATVAANMVRPIMAVWLIALVIFTIILMLQSVEPLRQHSKQLLIYFAATLIFLISSTGIYSWLYGFQVAPNNVAVGYSLATGTSAKTKGTYNPHIAKQVAKELKVDPNLETSYPRIAKTMASDIQDNLTELQGRAVPFMNQKMQGLMSEDYGYNWVLYDLSSAKANRKKNKAWYQGRAFLTITSYSYFQAMLMVAIVSVLLGLWLLFKTSYLNNYYFYSALLLDGFTISSLFLEVQGRYHVIIYLPIIFIIICGVAVGLQLVYKSWHTKQVA
ncbi:integral membrane protein [Lactiplantibacillus xiangfangensis]|uniref:Integral membrane protein n=2 Tax=Lactiplantibacillus xiangfangensis TaxID=942150 RepID=A0A0R2M403_9LACO|nr:integral membrane protein [Lactiplantibacillus xiangfangensis]